MKLLLAGASVRPLVASAIRAGVSFEAWDLFADLDTVELVQTAKPLTASIKRMNDFASLGEMDFTTKPDVAILSGGIERCRDVVATIADQMRIAGVGPDTICKIQDPARLAKSFRAAGCNVATTKPALAASDDPDKWLRKPIAGAGGLDIRIATPTDVHSRDEAFVFQKIVSGESWSALYVADFTTGKTACLGMTQQLVGHPKFVNRPFAYCGSIGPFRPPADIAPDISRLGQQLNQDFKLTGIFGVDLIVNRDGAWPVDVNPRITASAELYEMHDRASDCARAFNMVETQLGRVAIDQLSEHSDVANHQNRVVCGKAVLFNLENCPLTISKERLEFILEHHREEFDRIDGGRDLQLHATVSDIPHLGTVIAANDPLLTIRVFGRNDTVVRNQLLQTADEILTGLAAIR